MKRVNLSIAVCVMLTGAPIFADEKSPEPTNEDMAAAKTHFRAGTKLFDLGQFEEAAHEYEAAFRAHDDPFLLFNCAQAYRNAKNYPKALQFFHTYLRRMPNAPNRREVEERIVELQKLIEQQAKEAKAPPQGTLPENQAGQTAPTTLALSRGQQQHAVGTPSQGPEPPTDSQHPNSQARSGQALKFADIGGAASERDARRLKWAGLGVGGFGIASLGVGVACGVLSKTTANDLTRLSDQMRVYDPVKDDANRNYRILTGVFLGVGSVALITGTVLYLVGHRALRRAESQRSAVFGLRFAGLSVSFQ
jgi:tetratricopeptide (TPR) repeat protein